MKKKKSTGQIALHMVFLALMVVYILPILVLIASSFTDETALIQNGYSLIPSRFSLEAYVTAFRNPMKMVMAYGVNIFYTLLSTALSTLVVSLLAYPLSRDNFIWQKQLNFFVYFTMLFSGGLVPSYLLIRNILHLDDTIWVYIVPCLVSAYNVLIVRTSYRAIPNELVEAAKIDGAHELYICFRIIIPLSKASIASVSFLYLVDRWNDWMTSMLYIRNPDLYSFAVSPAEAAAGGGGIEKLCCCRRCVCCDAYGDAEIRHGPCGSRPGTVDFPVLPEIFYKGYDAGRRKGVAGNCLGIVVDTSLLWL